MQYVSSDGMLALMYYVWGGRGPCNIQEAREAVGEASTAWSQRRPHLWMCVCVCVSFVKAGWWIHTFRNTTGRPLTQPPFFKSYALLHTHKRSARHSGAASHTQRLLLCLHQKTHATPPFGSADVFCLGIPFKLSPQVSRARTHTQTQTGKQLLTLCTALQSHGNTSFMAAL